MIKSETFWELIDDFFDVIYSETGFPVLIYDTHGYIIRATDTSRIGDLHAGAEKIMRFTVSECAVTKEEAARNPLIKEGFSCPIIVDDKIVAGFGITGDLERVAPLAKVASRIIQAWIKEQEYLEKLANSERKYRNIFDHSLHGIFQATTKGRILTANPALAKILGYKSTKELIESITDISSQIYLYPEDRSRLLSVSESEGHVTGFMTKCRRKDGAIIDVVISARTLCDPETGVSFIEGLLEDITEKKKAEEAIRLSEEKYSKTFNNSPVWVVLSSLKTGRYIEVNETFLRTMGYQRHEVIDRTSLELSTWVYSTERRHLVEEINKNGKIRNFEVSRRTKNGRVLVMLFWGETIEIAGEMCLLSVSLNITARKLAEQEKARLESALAQSQKMDAIGQLAGGIAHDFNNMLGGIIGAAEMLSRYIPDDPKAKKFHKMILDSAGRSADLTRKLLTFSRSSPKVSSTVDIHEIVRDTVSLLENTIDRRINLDISLEAARSMVVGDPFQLQNVFLNLGINGSHAMPDGGTLCISSRILKLDPAYCEASIFDLEPGEYLEIEVRDTGCGIPSEHLNKIFEPFFTTKGQGQGTGLGLSAVYGTVQQHLGSITAYSEVGVGTVFHMLFPLDTQENITLSILQPAKKGSGRILVVDDEEVMRITAKAILDELGYEVLLADNGQEALLIFEKEFASIDLVILDMVMPVMNGRDCFAALKQCDPQVRVVLSSGFTREEDLEEMKNDGLSGFIRKPYRSTNLSQIVFDTLKG